MISVSISAPSRLAENTFLGSVELRGLSVPDVVVGRYTISGVGTSWWCRGCGYQVSVTAGTLFHKTKVPLWKWFWAIYHMSQCMKEVDVSYPTAWLMLQKLRQAMQGREAQYRLVLHCVSSVTYYLIQSYTSGCWLQANPKFEYLNSKQIRNSNDLVLQKLNLSFSLS